MPNGFNGGIDRGVSPSPPAGTRGTKGPPPGGRGAGPRKTTEPMKTAAWPGVPGPTQPGRRDRRGTKKLPQSPREEGL